MKKIKELYDWQKEVYPKWEINGLTGLLQAVPRSGKTPVALEIMKLMAVNTTIVVHTTSIIRQWEDEIQNYIPVKGYKVKVINIHKVSKTNYVDDIDTELLILDEVHRYVTPKRRKVFENIKYKFLLGMTATPNEEAIKLCGGIIDEVGFDRAKLSPFKVFYHEVKLARGEGFDYKILTRQIRNLYSREEEFEGIDEETANTILKNKIFERRRLVHNAFSRVQKVKNIVRNNPDKSILIICETISQADILAERLRCPVYHSESKSDLILERFRNGDERILVSVKMLKEGFDKPDLDMVILASSALSETHHIQAIARCYTYYPNKKAEIHILIAKDTTDETILRFHTMYNYEIIGNLKLPTEQDNLRKVYYWGKKYSLDYRSKIFKKDKYGKRTYYEPTGIEKELMKTLQYKGGVFHVYNDIVIIKERVKSLTPQFKIVGKIGELIEEENKILLNKDLTFEEVFGGD